MNALGTHDTPRILTLLGVGSPCTGAPNPGGPTSASAKRSMPGARPGVKLGAVLLYAFPGSPTLYYGDEAGMEGFEDPSTAGPSPGDGRRGAGELVHRPGLHPQLVPGPAAGGHLLCEGRGTGAGLPAHLGGGARAGSPECRSGGGFPAPLRSHEGPAHRRSFSQRPAPAPWRRRCPPVLHGCWSPCACILPAGRSKPSQNHEKKERGIASAAPSAPNGSDRALWRMPDVRIGWTGIGTEQTKPDASFFGRRSPALSG